MNSKQRLLAAIEGRPADHVPLTMWCFGFPAPPGLQWETGGRPVEYWYSKRLEHIHTLPQPWELEDDLTRAEAWLSLGVDDVLDVSVPWGCDAEVTWRDKVIPPGGAAGDQRYPVLVREYRTPAGPVRHAVRRTADEGSGWPRQPDYAVLLEDYNVARAVEHAVSSPADVAPVKHLFTPPTRADHQWFANRMGAVRPFAEAKGLLVQAWSAFGMDAAVWLAGSEGAVMLALDAPESFGQLIDQIAETDYARTELAAATDGVDVVCQRGWYSSTDFWSPALFDRFVFPHLAELTALAHRHGKRFAYTVTSGVERLGPRIAQAGVDLLYYVDPIIDRLSPEKARELFGEQMTVVGGTNALSLASGDPERIAREVRRAIEVLGPTHRFILSPTDALFPDTPWQGVECMIETWKRCR